MELSNHFKKAWQAYKNNFTPIIFILILFLGIYFSIYLVTEYFATPTFSTIEKLNITEHNITENISKEEFSEVLQAYQPVVLILILFLIAISVTSILLQAGFWGLCIRGIKRKVNIEIFFSAIKEYGLSYFLATIFILLIFFGVGIFCLALSTIFFFISPVLAWTGFIVGIVIYFLIMPFFIFISPAIVSGGGVLNSLSQSFSLGKKHYFELLLLITILFFISFLALIVPIIGTILFYFLIVPLATLTICSYYLEASKKFKKKR